MSIKLIGLVCLLLALLVVGPVSAQDGVIPPDPEKDQYDWYVASEGIISSFIDETGSDSLEYSPVTPLEGGYAWGQASLYSNEGKARTGLTSGIHKEYNVCAAVEWLKRGDKVIASNKELECKFTAGANEISRKASDAFEVFPAVYSTRTRHFVTGHGFLWDENDEVSS